MEFEKFLRYKQDAWAENRPARLRLPRPAWLTDRDALSAVYDEEPSLIRQGDVCWGCIVQANEILFRLLPHVDCPADIIFSRDLRVAKDPGILRDIAYHLYSYKDQPLDQVPQIWREAARIITDEYDRSALAFTIDYQGQPLSFRLIPVMIFRRHLPGRTLTGSLMPVLTAPGCRSALILPKRYWPKELTALWKSHRI